MPTSSCFIYTLYSMMLCFSGWLWTGDEEMAEQAIIQWYTINVTPCRQERLESFT